MMDTTNEEGDKYSWAPATQVRNSLSRQREYWTKASHARSTWWRFACIGWQGVELTRFWLKPLFNDRQILAAKILEAHYTSFFDR